MAFELPKLPYASDALEPHIDVRTMEIHHGKHHNGYTTKLNAAIEGTSMESDSIEDILSNMDMSNGALRNNGGGYFNHCLFWEILSPNPNNASALNPSRLPMSLVLLALSNTNFLVSYLNPFFLNSLKFIYELFLKFNKS